ncbi:MAG: stage II sporulation protein R [Bacillota bacterium]
MKRVKILLLIIILSIIYLSINVNSALVPADSSPLIRAYKNEDLIRLHVIANNNSPRDQYIKRRVRDRVNQYIQDKKIKNNIEESIDGVENDVNQFLKNEGVNYSARVESGEFYFPERTYGNIQLPSGKYKAFRIVLGEGQGSNWWCVLLPPVCVETEKEETIDEAGESVNIASEKKISFRLKSAEIFDIDKVSDWELLNLENIKINLLKPEITE